MEGETQKKIKYEPGTGRERGGLVEENHSDNERYGSNGGANEEAASPLMQIIYKEIQALRSDLKSEMSEFQLSFCNDMKKELNEFRGEINKKLQEATKELQATMARVGEAEQQITDIEEWDMAAKEALT